MNLFSPSVPTNIDNFDAKFERLNGDLNTERWVPAYERSNSSRRFSGQSKDQILNTYAYLILDLFRYAPFRIEEIVHYLLLRLQEIPISSRKLLQENPQEEGMDAVAGHTMALVIFYSLVMPYMVHSHVRHLLTEADSGNALAIELPLYEKLFVEIIKHATEKTSNFSKEFHLLCTFVYDITPSKQCKQSTLVGEDTQRHYSELWKISKNRNIEQCIAFIRANLLTEAPTGDWTKALLHVLASAACLLLGKLRYFVLEDMVTAAAKTEHPVILGQAARALCISDRHICQLKYILKAAEHIFKDQQEPERILFVSDGNVCIDKNFFEKYAADRNMMKKMSFLLLFVDVGEYYRSVRPGADWGSNGSERTLVTACITTLFQQTSPWGILHSYITRQLPRAVSWRPVDASDIAVGPVSKRLSTLPLFSMLQDLGNITKTTASSLLPAPLTPSSNIKIPATSFKTPTTSFSLVTAAVKTEDAQQAEPSTPPSESSKQTASDLTFARQVISLDPDSETQSDLDWDMYEVRNHKEPHFIRKGRMIRKKRSLALQCANQHVLPHYVTQYYEAGYCITNYYLQRRAFRAFYETWMTLQCNRIVCSYAEHTTKLGSSYKTRWDTVQSQLTLRTALFTQRLAFDCWIDSYNQRQLHKEEAKRQQLAHKIATW